MSGIRFDYQYLMLCIISVLLCVAPRTSQQKQRGGSYRIINGTDTTIAKYPFLVSVQRKGGIFKEHICGGTFITKRWIVTAAHCINDETTETIIIRAESTFHELGGRLLRVAQLVVHPNFNPDLSKDYDYGLIQLQKSFSRAVPAVLKNGPKRFRPGEFCEIVGWGKTSYAILSRNLLKIKLPIVHQGVCRRAYQDIDEITERMLCAGYKGGGTDACEGDSGGPFICRGMLTGIISWAEGCAEENHYGVYSYITPMRAWIRNHTGV